MTATRGASRVTSPRVMSDDQLAAEARALLDLDETDRYRWACDQPVCDGQPHSGWLHHHARTSQLPPDWDWDTWLILTGRGWGKTRTGAETTRGWAEEAPTHIAVVGETHKKVQEICFEHPASGLLAVVPKHLQRKYVRSSGSVSLTLTNGSVFRAFSAERPDAPRGYAFDKAWIDEFAAIPAAAANDILDNTWFALREAAAPQVIITTTPRPRPHVSSMVKEHRGQMARLLAEGSEDRRTRTVITTGTMQDNLANLSAEAVGRLEDRYAGTRLGRQELGGELLEDHPGAVWELWMFDVDGFRMPTIEVPDLRRRVLAIDPAASVGEGSDNTAFVVAGRDHGYSPLHPHDPRPRGYVLHAEEMQGLPEARAQKASDLFWRYSCDGVVVEANKGGDWIPAVIRLVDPRIPVKLVHATTNKRTRAQPVSALYEQMRVHHVGEPRLYDKLEVQMTSWANDPKEDSPDLMDALVWAMWALFIETSVQEAHVGQAQDRRLRGRR